jgi:dGTPase
MEAGIHTTVPSASPGSSSDDITFSVHDLVDFYCAGRIPLEQIASGPEDESQERTAFLTEVFERCEDLRERAKDLATQMAGTLVFFPINRRYVGSRDQRCSLWRFMTVLISRYTEAIHLAEPDETGRCVRIDPGAEAEIRMPKELMWHYVILQNEMAVGQRGQRATRGRLQEVMEPVSDLLQRSPGRRSC